VSTLEPAGRLAAARLPAVAVDQIERKQRAGLEPGFQRHRDILCRETALQSAKPLRPAAQWRAGMLALVRAGNLVIAWSEGAPTAHRDVNGIDVSIACSRYPFSSIRAWIAEFLTPLPSPPA